MDELRQRFNPDGSLLRQHQLRMLEMLLYIDGLCRKHGISYWLSSGTLLGAVRHGGFIPWDDDVDIEMMREDYLKLLNLLSGQDQYALQTHKTDSNYYFPFAKLRDRKSVMKETNGVDRNFNLQGVYIDIFPLEINKSPLSRVLWRVQLHIQRTAASMKGRCFLKKIYVNLLFATLYNIIAPLLRLCYKIGSQHALNHTFGVCFYKKRMINELFPLTKYTFEGHLFPVPGNYDAYLQRVYGDYMTLPALDEIVPHTTDVTFLA